MGNGGRRSRADAIAIAAMALWWSAGPGAESVTDDMLKIACDDLTPRHATYTAENSARTPCPYRLLVNATAAVPGEPVRLTLTSLNGSVPFKGFMVQARDALRERVIGTFLPGCSDGNRTHHMITCPNGDLPFVRRVWFLVFSSVRFSRSRPPIETRRHRNKVFFGKRVLSGLSLFRANPERLTKRFFRWRSYDGDGSENSPEIFTCLENIFIDSRFFYVFSISMFQHNKAQYPTPRIIRGDFEFSTKFKKFGIRNLSCYAKQAADKF